MMYVITCTNSIGDFVEKFFCLSLEKAITCMWHACKNREVSSIYINRADECFNGYLVNGNWLYGFKVIDKAGVLTNFDSFKETFEFLKDKT